MRYERKFVPYGSPAGELAALLKLHPAAFREAYPPRRVNNLYLDSPDLSGYLDSVDGARDRVKVRIRWYGEMFGPVAKPALEFKIKRGLLGRKRRFELEPFAVDRRLERDRVRALLRRAPLPADLATAVAGSELALLNGYHRAYFVSADGRFRITIDSDLSFYAVRPRGNTFAAARRDRDATIIELKYDREHDRDAHRISGSLPFRLAKSSKYVAGLDKVALW